MTTETKPKRIFKITENVGNDAEPYALVSPDELVVKVSASQALLSDFAFNVERADEVRYDGKVCQREAQRFGRLS